MAFSVVVDAGVSGAYFRKISSGQNAANIGVKGAGTLPELSFDPVRDFVEGQPLNRQFEHFKTGPLDRPSVYVGGNVKHQAEMDVGLVWDRVYTKEGLATYTRPNAASSDGGNPGEQLVRRRNPTNHVEQILIDGNGTVHAVGKPDIDAMVFDGEVVPNFAFRPFWRTIFAGKNTWRNAPVVSTGSQPRNVYFYPGDAFEIELRVVGLHNIFFKVARPGEGEEGSCQITFAQDRFGEGAAQSFKRVNSIDQFRLINDGGALARKGNENQIVLPSKTTARNATWTSFTLLRETAEIPFSGQFFTEVRGSDTNANYKDIFKVSGSNADGGETLSIIPNS